MEPVGEVFINHSQFIPAIVCSQHTRLVSSNRLCCYWSSHTSPITDLFASYHTHLVHLNCFFSHVSMQTVHLSESHAVYRTHLWSGWPFLLCRLITNSSSMWNVCCVSHTPSSGCPFLLFLPIANSLLNWTICPSSHTQIKPERVWCIRHRKRFTHFWRFSYSTVCDYCITHSFSKGLWS